MSTVNYVEPVVVEEPKPINWAEFSLKSMVTAYGLSPESAAELHAYSDYRDAAGLIPLVLRHWNNQKAFLAELRTNTQEAFEIWQFNDIVGAVLLLVSEKEPEHILFTREEGHFNRPRRRHVREEAPQVDPMASTVQELVQQVASLTQQLNAAAAAPEPVIEVVLEEETAPHVRNRLSIFDDSDEEDALDWFGGVDADDDDGLDWFGDVDDDDDGLIEFVEPEQRIEETETAVSASPISPPVANSTSTKTSVAINFLGWVDEQVGKLFG